jgi:hypothetical protein
MAREKSGAERRKTQAAALIGLWMVRNDEENRAMNC